MLLEICFKNHRERLIKKLSYYSRDEETSSDAVQEAFLKALNMREELENMPENSLKAWIYVTAKNILIDNKRKFSRITSLNQDEPYEDNNMTDKLFIEELISKLPSELIHIVSMRYFAQLNSVEIGKILEMPAATVRTKLRLATSIMKKYI